MRMMYAAMHCKYGKLCRMKKFANFMRTKIIATKKLLFENHYNNLLQFFFKLH